MANRFANLSDEGLEQQGDVIGGGESFKPVPTGVYPGLITLAYISKSKDPESKSESAIINVKLDVDGEERNVRFNEFILGRDGLHYKVDDKKAKVPLSGYTKVDELCQCATGLKLNQQDIEEKTTMLYDYDAKAERETVVEMITSIMGQMALFAVQEIIEDKQKNENGTWVKTGETRTLNGLNKSMVWRPDDPSLHQKTVTEIREGKPAKYHTDWAARNAGKPWDRSTVKKDGGKEGAPGAAGKAGKPGGAAAPSGNLFGKGV